MSGAIKDCTPEGLELLACASFPDNAVPLYRVSDRQELSGEAFRGFTFEAANTQITIRDEMGIPAVSEYSLVVSCATESQDEWETWSKLMAGLSAVYSPAIANTFVDGLPEPYNNLRIFSTTISGQEATVTEARRFIVSQTFTFSLAPVFIEEE